MVGPGAGVALAEGGLPALEQRVAALEAILAPFSIQPHPGGGYDITITRANLYVVNGAGSTATANGLGNVVIGYNESRGEGFYVRTGSHMLVVDSENNYSSWGGIVVGFDNETDGQYSSVSGGRINTAGGDFSSVSGGGRNQADGVASSVSGGVRNEAGGDGSSVSGGTFVFVSTPEGWAAGTILSTNVRPGSPRS